MFETDVSPALIVGSQLLGNGFLFPNFPNLLSIALRGYSKAGRSLGLTIYGYCESVTCIVSGAKNRDLLLRCHFLPASEEKGAQDCVQSAAARLPRSVAVHELAAKCLHLAEGKKSALPDCPSLPKTSLWRQICPSEEFVKHRATELFQYLSTAIALAEQAAESSSDCWDAADVCANLPIFLGMQEPAIKDPPVRVSRSWFLVSSGTMPNPSFDLEEATETLPTLLKTEICDTTPKKDGYKTIIVETPPRKVLQRAQTCQEARGSDTIHVQSKVNKDYRRSLSAPERLQTTLHGAGQQLESAWFSAGDKLWQILTSSRQPQLICASFGMSTPYWTARHVR
eukprot:s1798_g13.t1